MASVSAGTCKVCREPISGSHVSTQAHKYHKECFVCHQCLEPFKDNIFFEADGGYYCESDHSILHGENCGKSLVGSTFVRKDDKPYCKMCPSDSAKRAKQDSAQQQETCENCKKPVTTGTGLVFRGQHYHASHFRCGTCHEVLTVGAKEFEGELYCVADFEKIMAQICYACRRPIVGRSMSAIGKIYHPEHFVCWKCEKPFDGAPYFEYQSRPYCEAHYKELTGSVCQYCRSAAKGNVVSALGVRWCEQHFMCMGCFCALADGKAKFMEWDNKPFCKRCYEKLPGDVRRSLSKYKEYEKKFTPVFADGPR
ncbi:hypothetical protein HK105_207036 [Polyrhizophydium stewartii]|uniref:LIM zinc-binding domain-containing protein n=1 Tax=Polyrhizophydium stewartii TaxID=2732419 RepID=A0ABR4N1N5_9FUNG